MNIAVAMSGGVDSSVAAALSVERYGAENVFGVTMKLFCYSEGSEARGSKHEADKSCCSLDAITDAAAVCGQLGIKHYIVNLEKEFEKDVIGDFIAGYQSGFTPNPCVRCNQLVKYEHLLRKVQALGADMLVTGHYARVSHDEAGFHLLKGLDQAKDQSYFLYNLTQEQLAHVQFPVGELTKSETRTLAKKYRLKTAEKTESQDICFVTTSVQDFLKDKIKLKPGNIVDSVGKIVGQHNGLANYTIGQRKGLGGGFFQIMYVVRLDKVKNEVIIGPEEALYSDSLIVDSPHWVGDKPSLPFRCTAKIRYASEAAECTINSVVIPGRKPGTQPEKTEIDSSLRWNDVSGVMVTFSMPQKAITPGQSIVFYDGDEVIGGGVITKAGKS